MTFDRYRPALGAAILAALLGIATGLAAQDVRAADGAVLRRGGEIAAARCARCHAVGLSDERPHDIVIPFRDLHRRFPIDMLVEAKASGVISGHDEMPMFELSREDMHALLSYIDSLAPGKPAYAGP